MTRLLMLSLAVASMGSSSLGCPASGTGSEPAAQDTQSGSDDGATTDSLDVEAESQVDAAPALDPSGDEDGDGRTNGEEMAGYEVLIDFSGFGLGFADFLERRQVTSDPLVADTDGDGLDDAAEFKVKSDPRDADTDGDGLGDAAEVQRWLTSPVSVDTDGDSRGDPADPQAPWSAMFDGAELALVAGDDGSLVPGLGATSPTTVDTDGDGVSDYAERRNPKRSPTVADMPHAEITVEDGLDIRLSVTFSESGGVSESFGTATSKSQDVGISSTDSTSGTWSVGGSASLNGGVTAGTSAAALSGGIGLSGTGGFSNTDSYTFSTSSATALTEEYNYLQVQSAGKTVVTQGGSLNMGVRIANTGKIAYKISDFGIVARQYVASEGQFRTLAVMQPAAGFDSFVLGPGASTPVVAFSASDLDASLIRELLANPASLSLEPAGYELANRDGTNFIFVTEATFANTAMVMVDDGAVTATHRIATNVARDAGGDLMGIGLASTMAQLGYEWEAAPGPDGFQVLVRVGDVAFAQYTAPAPALGDPAYPAGIDPGDRMVKGIWAVLGAGGWAPLALNMDFGAIVLHNRDELRLVYLQDRDRDGLYDHEEAALGSSDLTIHSDADALNPTGDGLSDFFEVRVGWEVDVNGPADPPPYMVRGNPRLRDSDGDFWDDHQEYLAGTDPHLADTDGDGFWDSTDPTPLGEAP